MQIDEVMELAPVVPVLVVEDAVHARPIAEALVAGGLRALEVTLRTPQALECIRAIAAEVPDAVVGAGTVRTSADAAAAARAGARFAVSPGFTPAVGRACRDAGLPLLPGVATGSEIMTAQEEGFSALKFFPAVQAGGTAMLKAWTTPRSATPSIATPRPMVRCSVRIPRRAFACSSGCAWPATSANGLWPPQRIRRSSTRSSSR